MAKDNKLRGNMYNQGKQQPADELAEALNTTPPAASDATTSTSVDSEEKSLTADTAEQTDSSAQAGLVQDSPESKAEEAVKEPVVLNAAPQVRDTPVAKEKVAPPPVSVPVPPLDQKVQTRIMKSVERDLLSYMDAVHPKQSLTDEAGGAWQSSLFQTLKRILSNPEPETFKTEWNTLLAFFHKHQAEMFNENFMFRFQSTWKGSAKDYTTFRHLVYLAIRTANPQTRQQEARDIVLDRIVQGLDPQGATNLVNYYS